MGGSDKVNSNPRLRKGKPRQKAYLFLCGWNCSKEDVGFLIKVGTILKDVHLPSPYIIFSHDALQIFCTQRFLSTITK